MQTHAGKGRGIVIGGYRH